MNLSSFFRRSAFEISKHAPTILTGLSVVGFGATIWYTHKATVKSTLQVAAEIEQRGEKGYPDPDTKEILQLTWKNYVTPLSIGMATAVCMISGHVVSVKRQTALVAAYTVVERGMNNLRGQMVETLGEKEANKVEEAIIKKQIEANPAPDKIPNAPRDSGDDMPAGMTLAREQWSGRYLYTTVEKVRKAMNDVNEKCFNHMYASHNDFMTELGLEHLDAADEIGWNTDNMLDVNFHYVPGPNGEACMAIDYVRQPSMKYQTVWGGSAYSGR